MESTSPDGSDDLVSFRQGRGLRRQLSLPNLFFKAVGCSGPRLAQHPSVCLTSNRPATPGYQANQGNEITSPPLVPSWRNQVWFPEMIQLQSAALWSIPLRRDLLSQVQGKIWHPQPELWSLHVWPLDGSLVNSQ